MSDQPQLPQEQVVVISTDAAQVSRMLFLASELLDMYGDLVFSLSDRKDPGIYGLKQDIDGYRAAKGWSPNGFGGES
jgi:hypothetical protein